ncbi:uncharacterized protein LOC125558949 [Nematostella vectensis]|uniref:uncharacterized protein LOC125558949 n=1 Tax=Nematostella vectensis TaxID=45351 RepID=UPI0020776B68|nr:uncharacterized protein LOC125558949 [Nematostella vectensis]
MSEVKLNLKQRQGLYKTGRRVACSHLLSQCSQFHIPTYGRPKTTWQRTVERERGEAGWRNWDEVRSKAADREKWKSTVKALCATRHEEDRSSFFCLQFWIKHFNKGVSDKTSLKDCRMKRHRVQGVGRRLQNEETSYARGWVEDYRMKRHRV